MPSNGSLLIVAASERDANLYYATGFIAPDPFVFIQIKKRKYLLMSDLEVDRARSESKVDQVLSISRLAQDYKKRKGERPRFVDLIVDFLERNKVSEVLVPGDFPLLYADALRVRKIRLSVRQDPFFESRTIKTAAEVRAIESALRHTEAACKVACETIARSQIRKGKLFYKGRALTSESIKQMINVALMEKNCVAQHTIIAPGVQAVDPHNQGSGPLRPNEPIVMDIFPQSVQSRYYADLSRTVVRGKASPKVKKMFKAVLEGQHIAFKMIRQGADGGVIHQKIQNRFEELGFKTGEMNGRMQGFFHGTGHGVGLEIHEPPRISAVKDILKAGQVVTVEPGLYYVDSGGIRLEDMVLVTKTDCRILNRLPKVLEL